MLPDRSAFWTTSKRHSGCTITFTPGICAQDGSHAAEDGLDSLFERPVDPARLYAALDEVGLTGVTCSAAHLRSAHSKRIHALHRHSQEWAAYQEHMENQKETERNARQDAQLEATLAIARAAGTVKE